MLLKRASFHSRQPGRLRAFGIMIALGAALGGCTSPDGADSAPVQPADDVETVAERSGPVALPEKAAPAPGPAPDRAPASQTVSPSGPESRPDSKPDPESDPAPDSSPDVSPNLSPDRSPDRFPDRSPDPSPDYGTRDEAAAFIEEMHARHGFDQGALQQLFASARYRQPIVDAISRPAERTLSWADYRRIFLQPDRIEQGAAFWDEHAESLARAAREHGVAPEYVVAILGVETRYGRHRGRWRVIDALATLAFDYPPRAAFFRKELEQYLLLTREERQDPLRHLGSYAGAMGYGQFISSSYRAYAVDFDGDGVRDIWDDPVDAIGSVANYFAMHGWDPQRPVLRRIEVPPTRRAELDGLANRGLELRLDLAQLRTAGAEGLAGLSDDLAANLWRLEGPAGEEWVVGMHNFRVITRYNHSHLYALAVHDLAQAIRAARGDAAVAEHDDAGGIDAH